MIPNASRLNHLAKAEPVNFRRAEVADKRRFNFQEGWVAEEPFSGASEEMVKLFSWINKNEISRKALAQKLQCSIGHVGNILTGRRQAGRILCQAIEKMTGGEINGGELWLD